MEGVRGKRDGRGACSGGMVGVVVEARAIGRD